MIVCSELDMFLEKIKALQSKYAKFNPHLHVTGD